MASLAEKEMIVAAKSKGIMATFSTYMKLSGPGWLQSAITLGGGTLASALYLGVIAGTTLLWLQGFSVIMGVIMLFAIVYVVLSTGKKPFPAINEYINPVLGWGWAIATLIASFVWCLPQYSLACAALQQNLLPSLVGANSPLGVTGGKIIISIILFAISLAIVWRYNQRGKGITIFETFLKVIVGIIVICFFGVVLKLALTPNVLNWSEILKGFIPNLSNWNKPVDSFTPFINAVAPEFRNFWINNIVTMQKDVMIAAASAAIGINMTFLLPYSILARGWDNYFKGLALSDLCIGLVIPFILVTSCIIIASASQFHAKPGTGLINETGIPKGKLVPQYIGLLDARLKAQYGNDYTRLSAQEKEIKRQELPQADKMMAAMLVKRDAFNLAESLGPLLGENFSKIIFGIGVLGMTLSTIIIEMLIAGFVVCEIFGFPMGGVAYKISAILAGLFGMLGPFIWTGKALFWLSVPTSVIGMMLLPIAYITFMLMMNSKRLLGSAMPKGISRWIWNILMSMSVISASIAAGWSVWSKTKWIGVGATAVFILLAIIFQFAKVKNKALQNSL